MSNDNVINLKTKANAKIERELATEIIQVFNNYAGKISLASGLGLLELIADELKQNAMKELDNK